MRKLFLLLALMLCAKQIANAQYSTDRNKYDYHAYTFNPDDKYNPTLAGFASYIIPGLGHIYCNEPERGIKFMEAYGGAIVVTMVGGAMTIYNSEININNIIGGSILVAGVLSACGIQIWSCIDAVRVSKINNLAFREKSKASYSLKFQPYFNQDYNGEFYKGLTICLQIN